MFTGLVEGTGRIASKVRSGKGIRILIVPDFELKLAPGDSVAVDGVCLTVEKIRGKEFELFLSDETLRRTKFGKSLVTGLRVNLERPMTPEKMFGGHLVTGHVDTVGKLERTSRTAEGALWEISISEKKYMRYLVEKGSVAVDGVSLTVVSLLPSGFTIALIPFTLQNTNFRERKRGDLLNIEFDLIGKYIERFLEERGL